LLLIILIPYFLSLIYVLLIITDNKESKIKELNLKENLSLWRKHSR